MQCMRESTMDGDARLGRCNWLRGMLEGESDTNERYDERTGRRGGCVEETEGHTIHNSQWIRKGNAANSRERP